MQVSRKIKRSVQSGVEATWVRVNDLSISFPSRRSHRDHHVYDHECAFIKGDTLSVEEERGRRIDRHEEGKAVDTAESEDDVVRPGSEAKVVAWSLVGKGVTERAGVIVNVAIVEVEEG